MSTSCLNPLLAISLFKDSENKHHLKFLPKTRQNYNIQDLKLKYGDDNVFVFGCGSCPSCIKDKSTEWAIRCTLESYYHKFNYFITLTYNDNSVEYASKSDLVKFIDRLQKLDSDLKYFCSMERGETTNRLHFHVVLFSNIDLKLCDPVKLGFYYHYHSNVLGQKWTFGLHDITPFEHNCAGYVANYTCKDDSVLIKSRNLGRQYILDHKEDIIKNCFKLYGDFGSSSVVDLPLCFYRHFDDLLNEFKEFKKSVSHSYNSKVMRDLKIEHEEELNKQARNSFHCRRSKI